MGYGHVVVERGGFGRTLQVVFGIDRAGLEGMRRKCLEVGAGLGLHRFLWLLFIWKVRSMNVVWSGVPVNQSRTNFGEG